MAAACALMAIHFAMMGEEASFHPASGVFRPRKGFITFMLAAVFLFFLIPAAALISSRQPDLSFEDFRATLTEEVAIKQAFYQSSKQAAEIACAEARAEEAAAFTAGAPQPEPAEIKIREAALANALDFESQLRAQGYDAVFWCGYSDETSRKMASDAMLFEKSSKPPAGAAPSGSCLQSFQVSLGKTGGRLLFKDLGFSLYDRHLGTAKAAVFPYEKGVDFDCP